MKNINKIMCGILAILMFSNGYTKALTREVLSNIGQYLTLLVNLLLEKDEENILNEVCKHSTCEKCIQEKSKAKEHMYILGIFSLMHLYSAVERTYKIYTNSKVKPGDKTSQCSDLGIILQGINGAGYLFSLPAISDDGTAVHYYCMWAYLGYQNLADAYLRFFEKRQNSEKSSNQKVNEPRKVETKETQEPEVETKETQEPEVETKEV